MLCKCNNCGRSLKSYFTTVVDDMVFLACSYCDSFLGSYPYEMLEKYNKLKEEYYELKEEYDKLYVEKQNNYNLLLTIIRKKPEEWKKVIKDMPDEYEETVECQIKDTTLFLNKDLPENIILYDEFIIKTKDITINK